MSSSRILTNTAWNVAGLGMPILVAVIAMPLLIHKLGDARFGILALGWMVTGYFSLFDFGLGRATIRCMAVLRGNNANHHAAIFWNSFYLHLFLAAVSGLIFMMAVPWMVDTAFSIPPALSDEANSAFYWLAFSIPALIISSALRGPLEAEHRFDLVNAVKMPISVFNFLAPLLALQFTQRIDIVIAVIAVTRWIGMLAFGVLCFRSVPLASGQCTPHRSTVFKLLGDGGWLTVASVTVPLIMILDRSLISRLVSIEALTYYVVPYEVVTKMWILSASLLGAAYPLMSAAKDGELHRLCDQSLRWLLVTATPATLIVILFAEDLLCLWVGPVIAQNGSLVLQFLALGVWMSVLAQVPLTALQASKRADVVGIVQLCELPIYGLLVWWLIQQLGVFGAALAWAIRAALEWLVLASAMRRTHLKIGTWPRFSAWQIALPFAALMISWIITVATQSFVKLLLAFLLVGGLIVWQWRYLLTNGERNELMTRVLSRIKI